MQDLSWNAGKKFMGNVDAFLKSLLAFDKDNIPLACVEKCEKDFLINPGFNPDAIRSKSGAAAGLCGWVVNICKYFRIYQVRIIAAEQSLVNTQSVLCLLQAATPARMHGSMSAQTELLHGCTACLRPIPSHSRVSSQHVNMTVLPGCAGGGTKACRSG